MKSVSGTLRSRASTARAEESRGGHHRLGAQRGIVMITAMILLLVLTVLSLAMFQNFGLLERISGNTREKQRSFHVAQSTLEYAEQTLAGSSNPTQICTTLIPTSSTNAIVCNTPQTNAQMNSVPWTVGVQYTPPNLTVTSVGTATGIYGYASLPAYYIYPLGNDYYGNTQVFLVTAIAQGGNANAVTVVQSTYGLTSTSKDAGAL